MRTPEESSVAAKTAGLVRHRRGGDEADERLDAAQAPETRTDAAKGEIDAGTGGRVSLLGGAGAVHRPERRFDACAAGSCPRGAGATAGRRASALEEPGQALAAVWVSALGNGVRR